MTYLKQIHQNKLLLSKSYRSEEDRVQFLETQTLSNLIFSPEIKIRNFTLQEMTEVLPSLDHSPLFEAVIYYLITGQIPGNVELSELSNHINSHIVLQNSIQQMIKNNLDMDIHNIIQLAILVLQRQEKAGLFQGNQEELIEETFKTFQLLYLILHVIFYFKYNLIPGEMAKDDIVGNFCNILGFNDDRLIEGVWILLFLTMIQEEDEDIHLDLIDVFKKNKDPYLCLTSSIGLQEAQNFQLKCASQRIQGGEESPSAEMENLSKKMGEHFSSLVFIYPAILRFP